MLWWLAQNAVLAGVLAVIVAVVCRLGRFRPAVRHALWLVVLLKLVTPPVITWPGATLAFNVEPEAVSPPESVSAPVLTYQVLVPAHDDLIVALAVPEAAVNVSPSVADAPPPTAAVSLPPTGSAWGWPEWLSPMLARVVLLGAAALALLQVIRFGRFRRLLARGAPAPLALVAEVEQLAEQLSVRPPEVRLLSDIVSPLVFGLSRPLLLWPEGLSDSLSSQCQRAVIVHELAHLRRRDHWVAWLRALAGCVWWWNPVYWYVSRQLGQNAELACDAWVIGALPDARRCYAEALLAVAGRRSRAAALAPAVGMSGSRRDFERRLVMVMRDSVPCKAPVLGLIAVGVLALGVLPGLSLSQQADKPAKIVAPQQQTQPAAPAPAQVIVPYLVDVAVDPQSFVLYANQVAPAPGDERDRKIKDLEDKLQALLKEVKALRETKITNQAAPKPKTTEKPAHAQPWAAVEARNFTWQAEPFVFLTTEGQQHAVTLSRATYKLPKEKADALAAFLKHIKASVLETKVEDGGIVVTTTPDVQKTIGQLVGLMLGKPQQGAFHFDNAINATVDFVTPIATPPAKKP